MKSSIKLENVYINFPRIVEPETRDDGKEKYTAMLVTPRISKAAQDLMNGEAEIVETVGWTSMDSFKSLVHNGDEEERPEYKGSYYINTSSIYPPNLYDRTATECTPEQAKELFKSGAKVNALIQIYDYDFNNHRGIGARLRALQYVDKGKLFGAGVCPFRNLDAPSTEPQTDDFKIISRDDDYETVETQSEGYDPLGRNWL